MVVRIMKVVYFMKRDDLIANYQAAQRVRGGLSEVNDLGIHDLRAMPVFFDWVDCSIEDKKFVMFQAGADDGVALKFFWNGHYESYSLRLWARLACKDAKLKLDIGAHTGAYSLAALASGATNVVSFEPHAANFSRLIVNFRANGFSLGQALMLAVGEREEWSTFHLPTGLDYLSTGGSLLPRKTGLKFPIQTVSLDRFLGEANHSNVSVMKVDVEGMEISVLRGAESILERSKPIIFFECIEENSGSMVESFLVARGFQFFLLDDAWAALSKVRQVRPERNADGSLNMSRLNRLAVPAGFDDSLLVI